MIKAIIFDFDGVLVDSEPLHYRAFVIAAKMIGFEMTYDDYLKTFIGFDDRDVFRVMLTGKPKKDSAQTEQKVAQMVEQKKQAFADLVEQGASMIQGVWKLIDQVKGEMPIAIASGATQADIEIILKKLERRDLFEVIVTADDVERSKPDPATYVLAAQKLSRLHPKLDLQPQDCLAIEDTFAGLTSAKKAGLKTIALTTTNSADNLQIADKIVEDPNELDWNNIKTVFN